MTPSNSVDAFETFVEASGHSLVNITPLEGIAQMFNFYKAVPAEGCSGDSGDMLLFQWGTYDFGEGIEYMVDITRQFIESSKDDDDAISQLQLTFRFAPTPDSNVIGAGDHWCKSLNELEPFRELVLQSPQLSVVAGQEPPGFKLHHEYV
jgi:hypothetical protein